MFPLPLILNPPRNRIFPIVYRPRVHCSGSVGGQGDDVIIIADGQIGPPGPPGPPSAQGPAGPPGRCGRGPPPASARRAAR